MALFPECESRYRGEVQPSNQQIVRGGETQGGGTPRVGRIAEIAIDRVAMFPGPLARTEETCERATIDRSG